MNIAELVFQALTSGTDALRAHHGRLPREGEATRILPLLTITTVAGTDEVVLRGDGGLRFRLIQIDAWGSSRKLTDDYAEVARSKMYAATTFSVGASGPSGGPDYDDEANLFRNSMEYRLQFNP